jgi:hypothetical protein
MHKIKGLTESQTIEVLTKVAKNNRNRAFGSYAEEDIEQEAWIIALKVLKDFKPKRATTENLPQALENWLNTVVSRRLKNLYRDKYVVPQKVSKSDSGVDVAKFRNNLMHPVHIGEIDENTILGNAEYLTNGENLFLDMLVEKLDFYLFDVLETILSGECVNCYYKNKLFVIIKQVWAQYEQRTKTNS